MVFDAYARYYDLLYRDKNYAAEADYIVSRIRENGSQAGCILELGCGTGAHAEHLARMGYRVHGVDISETMLSRAEERRRALPSEIAERLSFEVGDVRSVRVGEIYDAVVSLFHVMSYQTSNSDLEAAFETASVHLRPGGLFLFDFWYGPAVLTQKPEVRVKRLDDDDIRVTRIAEPVVHTDANCVDVNYTVFIEDKATGKMQCVREAHRMRYFFLPELLKYQKGVFEERQTCSWMSEEMLTTESWGGFQVLAKG